MTLLDTAFSNANVDLALRSLNRNSTSGLDGLSMEQSIAVFQASRNHLFEAIRNGSYRPSAAKRIYIHNGSKQRPIDLLNGQDRILQRLFAQVLMNEFDPNFSNSSHGFRSGRGRQTAARQILTLFNEGGRFVLQLDISKYFQNIDRNILLRLLEKQIGEPNTIQFIQKSITAGYYENKTFFAPDTGIPQGAPLSPVLANVYLNELDQELESKNASFVRFADDIAIVTSTREEAASLLQHLKSWLPAALSLSLSEEKTKIVPAAQCRILGYQFSVDSRQNWICNPPLPAEQEIKPNHETSQKNLSGHQRGRVIAPNINPALFDLKEIDLNETPNTWMPKDKADQIKKAVMSEFTVAEVAQAMGFTVVSHSADTLSLLEHDSCIIWPATNRFKRYSVTDKTGRAIGGTPFDFYLHFSEATYMQALNIFKNRLTGSARKVLDTPFEQPDLTPMERDMLLKEEFAKRNTGKNGMKKVFAYLVQTREIDPEIVSEQVNRGCLQQVTDDKGRTCCLFIGYDDNGLWNGACFRSTSSTTKFMGDLPGCDYTRGWFYDPQWDPRKSGPPPDHTKPLLCFESYIEMLSYMSILKEKGFDYRHFSYLACGSITKSRCIDQICEQYGFSQVKVMFNNDFEREREGGENKGKQAAELTADRLCKKGITAKALIPSQHNDWNDMLRALKEKNPKHELRHSSNRYDIGR